MTKSRIMLVEDEAITARDIRTSLEELGYEMAAVAASGAEAVRLAAEVRPDLILMDIVLDGPMSGIEAAEAIRRAHAIPVVFLTAYADVETVEKARITEPFGYLLKPCALDTLRSTIEVALYKGEADARRRKEEEKKAKHEAKTQQIRKAESLARMAGAIAHHFNNLLGAVMGNVEMAMDLMPPGTPAVLADSLTDALQAARKAANLSALMLTYLGQSFSDRKPLALAEVCGSSLPSLRAALPGNVTLEADLPSSGPLVRANESHIRQVLVNLVTNAWEAIGVGRGAVLLSVKTVSPTDIQVGHCFPPDWQPQDNTYACLEVADSGCGIAVKNIEEIFDPFFSDKFTGRGLGLPVVLGIVRAHNGAITVESQVGQGSVFRVYLPALAHKAPSARADQEAKAREKAWCGTVLLVEDNELVRNMATKMLMSLGFSVLSAKDGFEALDVFLQHKDEIRCVLSDVTMPRMDGWETLTALRKIVPDIPVILASGYEEARVMAGDHPERPQAFLGKPYLRKELSNAISQALGSQQ